MVRIKGNNYLQSRRDLTSLQPDHSERGLEALMVNLRTNLTIRHIYKTKKENERPKLVVFE